MVRLYLLIFIAFCCQELDAQNGFIVLKKRNKNVQYFAPGSNFTFQLNDGQWLSGIITKITVDSFYFTQEIIHYYPIGTDTIRYKGLRYALSEIHALPTKRQSIFYDHGGTTVGMGRERFVWVQNGLLFKAAGAGYACLNVANDIYYGERPFTSKKLSELGISAGVFMLGTILGLRFDPYLRIGRKYKLKSFLVK